MVATRWGRGAVSASAPVGVPQKWGSGNSMFVHVLREGYTSEVYVIEDRHYCHVCMPYALAFKISKRSGDGTLVFPQGVVFVSLLPIHPQYWFQNKASVLSV